MDNRIIKSSKHGQNSTKKIMATYTVIAPLKFHLELIVMNEETQFLISSNPMKQTMQSFDSGPQVQRVQDRGFESQEQLLEEKSKITLKGLERPNILTTSCLVQGSGDNFVAEKAIVMLCGGQKSTKEIVHNLLHSTYLNLYKGHFSRANNEKMTKALK